MTRQRISSGSRFEDEIGYSRAIVCEGWVFVAGTTGYDYSTMVMPDGIEAQCANTLATIKRALLEADTSFDDVVRVRYILRNPDDWEPCWPLVSAAFAKSRPASTMMVAGLQNPEMLIEIEVTAFRAP